MITRIPSGGALFDRCYALMEQSFGVDELVNRAEYEDLLDHPSPEHEFVMLAQADAGGDVIGMVAGSYLRCLTPSLPSPVDRGAFAMIEYLAVREKMRYGKGHGRALLAAFEQTMLACAAQRGEQLCAVVGEVEEDLLPFKFKTGYRLCEDVCYAQPPIEFDKGGNPLHPPVPKLLMVKPFPDDDHIHTDLLRRIVATIYEKRYVPMVDESTMGKIRATIFDQVFAQFDVSLTERSTVRLFHK